MADKNLNSLNFGTGDTYYLNAGNVKYDPNETFASGTVGAKFDEQSSRIANVSDNVLKVAGSVSNVVVLPTYTQGGYYEDKNRFVESPDWGYTDLIAVDENELYSINTPSTQYVNFYDASRNFIESRGTILFTVPSGAAFVRLSVFKTRQSICILTKGGAYQSYLSSKIGIDKVSNYRHGSIATGNLTDMNDALDNTYYEIQVTDKTRLANLPSEMPADGLAWYSITLVFTTISNITSKWQILFSNDMNYVFRRQCQINNGNITWYSWKRILMIPDTRKSIVVDINGNGDYNKFTDALSFASANPNTDIYVKNGTYDITNEINIETAGYGPTIGNKTRIFFDSNAVVSCIYTGDNENVKRNFSPLNAATGNGGFELHNAKIKCKNTRYCVHDEHVSDSIPYVNKYINCDMYLDNSESSWDSPACIGGGLGKFGIIEIDGGYYEGTVHVGDNYYGEISYHNTSVSGAKSEIHIKNVYCKNNTVRFGYYGESQLITKCFVTGNSFAVDPLLRAETDSSTIENMEMYNWNNEIHI